jgi:cytochrome P450
MAQTTVSQGVSGLPALPLPRERECPFGPPPEYGQLREQAPVSRVACPTGITAWLVTRYADVRAVLADPQGFRTRPGQAAHILTHMSPDLPVGEGEFSRMDGPEHLRFRRHMAPEISAMRRIDQLRPLVTRIVDDRVDTLAGMAPPVDLHTAFSQPVTTAVIAELLGVPMAERGLFQQAADTFFTGGASRVRLDETLMPLFGYLHGLVARRRKEPGDDALSHLVARSDSADARFTDQEVVSMAAAMLIAGYDTTASMITYGTLMLLEHPDQLARLREDPGLAATAGEEMVRYLGVGTGLLREVSRDTEIGGQPVAAGDYVVLAIQSANRDPELAADADRLDLGRKAPAHVGFGHGPHQCVGQQLARLELTTVLGTVPGRIPTLRLAVPLAEVEFKADTVVRGPSALPVTWDAVLPAPGPSREPGPTREPGRGDAAP